ncbi:transmembrane GTPase Marf [Ctenocephalides felis]|uniref:transmembrane GTPase Marf n=1 Tax=Ctenocephalides felis TaxID=7515 RepID=UPI000E6E3842|nr:transmembrane GTPase Marf [Ctenocephalides felis]
MAAYLNRTISMVAGSGQNGNSVNNRLESAMAGGDHRSLRSNMESSPLQIFVKAKKKINDIFGEIEVFVQETCDYMEVMNNSTKEIIDEQEVKKIGTYVQKVRGIREVLCRDHMKVAFFGRTSNGKSTVINAMLRDKILPSGIGHTTNCFLQVEGTPGQEAYLVTEGSEERMNVKSVGQLAHALCEEKLSESQLVRIFWPKERCLLLRDDVVFVDSPGVDVTPNLDGWIDKHCLDADVFVLVANAESTLMVTEKNFFHKVSTRLSKPNIFVLNNRWDASASEPEFLDQVRAQHLERSVDFLVKELKVCTPKEADERVFFISAKEVLNARLQEQKGQPPHSGALADGFQTRYFEFQDFERKFEECISQSAVKTKFEQHSQGGKNIAIEMESTLDSIYKRAGTLREETLEKKRKVSDSLNYTETQLMAATREMKEKIHGMVEDVEQRVSKALSEEIRRLAVLVDEFSLPFHAEPLVLNVYKRELHAHVENGLGSNLRARLSTALAMNVEAAQKEMCERMGELLSDCPSAKQQIESAPRTGPFEILYRLNCDNLCADFTERLEFRFSWGITALIQRFAGKKANRLAIANYPEGVPNQAMTPTASGDYSLVSQNGQNSGVPCYASSLLRDEWGIISRVAVASIGSQGTMGGLLVAGFMLKTVGWRLLAAAGALYASAYLYERLTWTNKAKERAFKKQYVQHATRKLRLIVDLTSANCSHQVQQELSSTFARLCHLVDEATTSMNKELCSLEQQICRLESHSSEAKVLRNKANYIMNELDLFEGSFLKM